MVSKILYDLDTIIDGYSLSSIQKTGVNEDYNVTNLIFDSASVSKITIGDLDVVDMLKKNNNIILHGAPGTGKTYLAKKIAEALGATKENGLFKMVQFHPSYDYTDFVEGLRPNRDGDGNIVFEHKDGVFKALCKEALKNLNVSNLAEDELKKEYKIKIAYQELIAKIRDGELLDIPQKSSANVATFDHISDQDSIIFKRPSDGRPSTNVVSLNRLLLLSQKYPDIASLDNMKNLSKEIRDAIGGCNCTWYWATLRYLYEMLEKNKFDNTDNIEKESRKNFVFVIDEINRGDLSKIFGELFFSIDPGYRGIDGKITTQYQNMLIGSGDEFEKGFYIPDNVYIIGTMNDIDRSVESMDFAMRRRFQFIEVKPEDRVDEMFKDATDNNKKELANEKMKAINDTLKKLGFEESYYIGPSYFIKLAKGEESAEQLWGYRLKGLLREYLRGMDGIEDKLTKLEDAFKNADVKAPAEPTSEVN